EQRFGSVHARSAALTPGNVHDTRPSGEIAAAVKKKCAQPACDAGVKSSISPWREVTPMPEPPPRPSAPNPPGQQSTSSSAAPSAKPSADLPDAGHVPMTEELDRARWTLPPV